MAISITKTIPNLSGLGAYSINGGGAGTVETKLTLSGVQTITPNTKKTLIKVKIAQSKGTYTASPSDLANNVVVDLKRIEDTIKVRGWLEDTPADDSSVLVGGVAEDTAVTAWEKFWILRAMCTSGGALTNVTIDNVQFTSSTQEAFLEDITGIINPTDIALLNTNTGNGNVARVQVELSLYLGDAR